MHMYLSWDKVSSGDSMLLSVEHSILLGHVTVWL